ncbi:predicted protein, partial [Nematostella vectensis]
CKAPLDVVFLVDGSRSVERQGVGNFRRELSMIRDMSAGFIISRTNVRFGLVVYGTRPRVVFGLNGFRNNGGLFNALNRPIKNPQTGSRIGLALRAAYTRVLARSPRRGATKIIVVLADGRSEDDVRRPSNALQARGVKIFAIGIGRYINGRQLDQLASRPRRTHIF